MPALSIIIAPDPRLKQRARPVGEVDSGVRRLMDDMLDVMHQSHGIGLAAPQVGVLKRVIVVDVSPPEEETLATGEEGCLSLPEQFAEVTRPERVRVRYRDEHDVVRELEADGLLAKCIQHEIDHLDGVLFVDHLSSLKRGIILRKLAKAKRLEPVAG